MTALYYRGYYIELREATLDDVAAAWIVFRTGVGGSYEEFGVADSEKAARQLVDKIAVEPA